MMVAVVAVVVGAVPASVPPTVVMELAVKARMVVVVVLMVLVVVVVLRVMVVLVVLVVLRSADTGVMDSNLALVATPCIMLEEEEVQEAPAPQVVVPVVMGVVVMVVLA